MSITAEAKTIEKYFELKNNEYFNIPKYQRAYNWGKDECDRLWDDINEYIALKSNDNYFFGSIIIDQKEDGNICNLIDGQQRTTTFLLLLKALLIIVNDKLEELSNSNAQGVDIIRRGLQDIRKRVMIILYHVPAKEIELEKISSFEQLDNNIITKCNILNNESINEKYGNELLSILKCFNYEEIENNTIEIKYKKGDNRHTNYFKNFKFFYNKLKILDSGVLLEFSEGFLEKCEVLKIRSTNEEQAIAMFNSLNSSGMPLNDADIISSVLSKEAITINGNINNYYNDFNDKWAILIKCVEKLEKLNIGNIDALLLQYMYFLRTINGETITTSGGVDVTTPGVKSYFININSKFIKNSIIGGYNRTNPVNKNPICFVDDLLFLAEIWPKVFELPLAKVLFKFNQNFKLFLASYLFRYRNQYNSSYINKLTSEDSSLNLLFRNPTFIDNLNVILNCLIRLFAILELVDTGFSSNKFKTFLFEEEIKFVDTNISEFTIEQDFNKHINTNWGGGNISAIKQSISDYKGGSMIYLNEYLFDKQNFAIYNECDIEHIMPDSGRNIPSIQSDAGISNKEEFEEYVNKVGNKILLESEINRGIGNDWFRNKLLKYQNSHYMIAKNLYDINKNILTNSNQGNVKPEWKKQDIEKATDDAITRIINYLF